MDDRVRLRMRIEGERNHEQVARDEHEHQPLPLLEAAGHRYPDQDERRDRNRDELAHAEIAEGEVDPDELRHDREEVEDEEVDHRERAPEAAEALDDQAGVPDARHRPQAHDHLLVDDQHRDQQQQNPEQARPVVLPGLDVRRDAAGVVVADHHDQARTHDRQQREQPPAPGAARADVVEADRPEGALDVADVRFVEDRRRLRRSGLRLDRDRRPRRVRLVICHSLHLLPRRADGHAFSAQALEAGGLEGQR